MKPAPAALAALALLLAAPPTPRAEEPVNPPSASWAGTTDIAWTVPPKRVGILAYCADLYHNAGDTGLQAGKRSAKLAGEKANLQALVNVGPNVEFDPVTGRPIDHPWFLDGPFRRLGQYGAQNVADYFAYDDGIDRERDLTVIDGDLLNPTATQLIQNFDIVVAYTDNKCGQPIPTGIANSASTALATFAQSPGKKLILTGFAFSTSIGFGNAIFANGLSPLRKGGPGLAPCSRGTVDGFDNPAPGPCQIGVCPAGCGLVGDPPECQDSTTGAYCPPLYEPSTATTLGTNNADGACSELLNNVRGPTSSSWGTALTQASVAPGASLCFNYNSTSAAGTPLNGAGVPFVAINQARNVVAINAFPPDAKDIQKFWFGCIVGNAIQYLSGDTHRCPTYPFCQPAP